MNIVIVRLPGEFVIRNFTYKCSLIFSKFSYIKQTCLISIENRLFQQKKRTVLPIFSSNFLPALNYKLSSAVRS